MEKPQQEEIPKSIIKGSGIVAADLSSLHGKGKILFVHPGCFVIGLDNSPYMLFTTPEFNEGVLPPNIGKHIYDVKKLVLQPTFSVKASKEIRYCTIPKWLNNFKKIEYLRFEYVELDDLEYLENLPIQHIVFENVKYNDDKKVISAIKRFKHLKEISYDQSVSTDLRHSIKGLNLKLSPVPSSL
jgi:hypothetical protein